VVAGLFVVAVSAYKLLHRDRAPHPDEPGMFRRTLRPGLVTTALAGLSGPVQCRPWAAATVYVAR